MCGALVEYDLLIYDMEHKLYSDTSTKCISLCVAYLRLYGIFELTVQVPRSGWCIYSLLAHTKETYFHQKSAHNLRYMLSLTLMSYRADPDLSVEPSCIVTTHWRRARRLSPRTVWQVALCWHGTR
jgi:hypothetical protein